MAEKKKIPTWVWVAGVVLILLVLFFWYKSCNKASTLPPPNDSITYWRNKAGEEVASRKAAEDQFSIFNEEYLDSIARLLDTKARLLNQITVLTQKGKTTIKTDNAPIVKFKTDTLHVGDSAYCPDLVSAEQGFKSPYHNAYAIISLNGGTSSLSLETYDTLLYADKIVKEGNIFNRKRFLQVDVTNTNDSAHITGLNIYRKRLPPPKKVGIGVQLGVRGTVTKNFIPALKPYGGIGLSYNFIRL